MEYTNESFIKYLNSSGKMSFLTKKVKATKES